MALAVAEKLVLAALSNLVLSILRVPSVWKCLCRCRSGLARVAGQVGGTLVSAADLTLDAAQGAVAVEHRRAVLVVLAQAPEALDRRVGAVVGVDKGS